MAACADLDYRLGWGRVPQIFRRRPLLGDLWMLLFNRYLQPTIDVENESLFNELTYSSPEEMKAPLRWTALLYGKVKADLALTTGVHTGQDAIRAILAGATAVQVAATLYKNGIPYIITMLQEMEQWMDGKGYQSLGRF